MIDLRNQMTRLIEEETHNQIGSLNRPYKTKFLYSNGLPGTYKTTAIIKVTDDLAKKNRGSVHAVPSKLLCTEVREKHQSDCIVLNSSTVDSVSRNLRNLVVDVKKPLIVTHHSILNTERIPVNNHPLFFDELFDPTIHLEINDDSSDAKQILISLIHIIFINQKYSPIVIDESKKADIWKIIYLLRETPGESNLEKVLTMLARSSHFDVWSHNQYNRDFLSGNGNKFVITAFIKPDIMYPWKDVRFSSAGFDKSLLFFLWNKEYNIEWKKDIQMMKYLCKPRKTDLNVYYWAENRAWSKAFGKQSIGDSDVLSMYYRDVNTLIRDINLKKVLLCKNKDDSNTLDVESELLPYGSEGLNAYTSHNTLVEAGAYNKPNAFYEFMKFKGLSEESKADTVEKVYQALYRTQIRLGLEGQTNLIIPSKNIFPQYLRERFDSVNLIKFGELSTEIDTAKKGGRPKGTQKIDESISDRHQYIIQQKFKARKNIKESSNTDEVVVTIFDKPRLVDNEIASFPSHGDVFKFKREEFYLFLINESKKKKTEKYNNLSFSLIEFDDNHRIKKKAIKSYGICFDFDTKVSEGVITEGIVKEIINEDIEGLIYSTYSEEYKKRLIILYKECIDPSLHVIVSSYLYDEFEKRVPECLIDKSSLSLSQSWLLPRKSANSVDYFSGSAFDPLEYLSGTIHSGKSELQRDSMKKEKSIISSDIYDSLITPIISKMCDGNRFFLAQKSVGICVKYCSNLRDRLFEDFKDAGLSESHYSDLNHFFDQIL